MDSNKNIETLEDAARAAEEIAVQAQNEPDAGSYIHKFKKPFEREGRTYEQLTFRWAKLTGADYLDIENELLMRGKTLIVPEYTGPFLCGLAARACEELAGVATPLRGQFIRALPLRDFKTICGRTRAFLTRAES